MSFYYNGLMSQVGRTNPLIFVSLIVTQISNLFPFVQDDANADVETRSTVSWKRKVDHTHLGGRCGSIHLQRKGRYQQTGNFDAPNKFIHFPLLNLV